MSSKKEKLFTPAPWGVVNNSGAIFGHMVANIDHSDWPIAVEMNKANAKAYGEES